MNAFNVIGNKSLNLDDFVMIPPKMEGELVPYDRTPHPKDCTSVYCSTCSFFIRMGLPLVTPRCQSQDCRNICCTHSVVYLKGIPVCKGCDETYHFDLSKPKTRKGRNLFGMWFKSFWIVAIVRRFLEICT